MAEQVAGCARRAGAGRLGQVAVLARKRSHFPRLEAALRDRGVPCEVVGLGGLLLEPEVATSSARCACWPTRPPARALVRLLAGPRWRIGPRDLDALGRRARRLAVRRGTWRRWTASALRRRRDRRPDRARVRRRRRAQPGRRARRPRASRTRTRRRATPARPAARRAAPAAAGVRQPLPDLVADVARTLGLDVELASRPGVRAVDALLRRGPAGRGRRGVRRVRRGPRPARLPRLPRRRRGAGARPRGRTWPSPTATGCSC